MKKHEIWHWQDFESWREPVWELMKDLLTPAVIEEFKKSPPEYIVGDNLSWLEDIISETDDYIVDVAEILAVRLHDRYHALRAYHGSRPLDINNFYQLGLHRLNPTAIEMRAREIFLNGQFPELTESAVQQGIDSVGRIHREGLLYFEANESHLTEYCAHYMLYGSEYLCGIAANIPGPRDYRQHLKNFGIPTIFVCDVPFSILDDGLLKEFAGYAVESMFSHLLDPEFKHGGSWRSAGLYTRHNLSPHYVIGHKHPEILKDPLLGDMIIKIKNQ